MTYSTRRSQALLMWCYTTGAHSVSASRRRKVCLIWRGGTLAALRALWPRAFDSRRGQIIAVALIAVVFGVGHLGQGVIGVVVTGFLGLLLGLIMVFHKSIWPAVIAHGMFDAVSLALLPWALEQFKKLQ